MMRRVCPDFQVVLGKTKKVEFPDWKVRKMKLIDG
jgi:hypothetical protein